MLSQLYIENIAVIREATIDFSDGLNVFTGETGAGKTILISAINAVLGGRTSRDIIRSGEEKATVSALFSDVAPEIRHSIAECGYPADNGQYLVTRELDAEGRGGCRINGRPATTALLREISSRLITIHGQHDNQELLASDRHMDFIDSFGQLDEQVKDCAAAYRAMAAIRDRLDGLRMDESEKLRRIDMLQYQVDEINAAGLTDGEEEQLEEQRRIIRNSEKISGAISAIAGLLSGDDENDGILGALDELSGELKTAAGFVSEFSEYTERLTDASYNLEELAQTARGYLEEYDFDPRQLDSIESRLDLLYRLKKKYNGTLADIIAHGAAAQQELDALETADEQIAKLEAELAAAQQTAQEKADALTERRAAAGKEFAALVERELTYLDMGGVTLCVDRQPKPLSANGQDKIEFLVSANPGEPPRPMARIASGGELSRIMLSIKNVLADRDSMETMIFDEVDSGVSGRAAQKIGAKLAEVAARRQVIVVTHLASVAAFAKRHIRIYKTVEDGRTFTRVAPLDREQRRRELARIMVGENITESALKSAEEMLILSGNGR